MYGHGSTDVRFAAETLYQNAPNRQLYPSMDLRKYFVLNYMNKKLNVNAISFVHSPFHIPNTIDQLARRRIPGWIRTRRTHVECAPFLLSIRDVRFVFYITAMADLCAGNL